MNLFVYFVGIFPFLILHYYYLHGTYTNYINIFTQVHKITYILFYYNTYLYYTILYSHANHIYYLHIIQISNSTGNARRLSPKRGITIPARGFAAPTPAPAARHRARPARTRRAPSRLPVALITFSVRTRVYSFLLYNIYYAY